VSSGILVGVEQRRQTSEGIEYRALARAELARVGEIDRTEQIDTLYVQDGRSLREVHGEFSAAAWSSEGQGEHSVAHHRDECERLTDAGGATFGAFVGDRLVGIGIVLPHLRADVAQLAYLYVSDGFRGQGIGVALTEELERVARRAGDRSIVVSAVPSQNTVDFYRRRGYEPMAEPLPELYELEPDDVHLEKRWR
jgi:GNAT superfamily N-acetyltransferase